MLPVGPTGSGFSCWDPATKHLAFIFNHTSLSTNNVGRRQETLPYMPDRRGQHTYIQTEKKKKHTQTYQRAFGTEVSSLEVTRPLWWEAVPPNSVLSQQVGPFMWDPFLFRVFWFKEQQKQTEANPLSSQQLLAGYQLGVIMMSHSSGVSSLMLDIKYDFGLLRRPPVIVMLAKQNTLNHVLHLSWRQFHDKQSV